VAAHEEGNVFVNVQGDEPLAGSNAIDCGGQFPAGRARASISTVATPSNAGDIMDPNVVKVVLDFGRECDLFFACADPLGAGYGEQNRACGI